MGEPAQQQVSSHGDNNSISVCVITVVTKTMLHALYMPWGCPTYIPSQAKPPTCVHCSPLPDRHGLVRLMANGNFLAVQMTKACFIIPDPIHI